MSGLSWGVPLSIDQWPEQLPNKGHHAYLEYSGGQCFYHCECGYIDRISGSRRMYVAQVEGFHDYHQFIAGHKLYGGFNGVFDDRGVPL